MIEVPSGPIGCVLAALSLWVVETREIQTADISFAQVCTTELKKLLKAFGTWFGETPFCGLINYLDLFCQQISPKQGIH